MRHSGPISDSLIHPSKWNFPTDVCYWPFAAQIDVRSYVGNWGITGLVMLTVSFVDPDPEATLMPKLHQRQSSRLALQS